MAWEDNYRDHELWSSVADALEAVSKAPTDDDLIHLRALLTEISGHEDQPHAALATEHLARVKNVVDDISAVLPTPPRRSFSSRRITETG